VPSHVVRSLHPLITGRVHFACTAEDNTTEGVPVLSDSVVPYRATQEERQEGQEAQDTKKPAFLPRFLVLAAGVLKSEFASKVHSPVLTIARWAWKLYLRIAVVLVKGVRAVTWPISHLL